jgi:Lipopolysaccharide-assembly
MRLTRALTRTSLFCTVALMLCGFKGCYQPVTDTNLPGRIKTIAVPAFQFESNALRFKVESKMTTAVMKELVRRGHGLKVQGDREGADAVIEGVIKNFNFSGVLLDSNGRARVFEVTIVAAVTVRDQRENRVLYDNQNFIFRDSYEFTSDPRSFFNEEDPAVDRMARSFAESVVSTLVTGFGVNEIK